MVIFNGGDGICFSLRSKPPGNFFFFLLFVGKKLPFKSHYPTLPVYLYILTILQQVLIIFSMEVMGFEPTTFSTPRRRAPIALHPHSVAPFAPLGATSCPRRSPTRCLRQPWASSLRCGASSWLVAPVRRNTNPPQKNKLVFTKYIKFFSLSQGFDISGV